MSDMEDLDADMVGAFSALGAISAPYGVISTPGAISAPVGVLSAPEENRVETEEEILGVARWRHRSCHEGGEKGSEIPPNFFINLLFDLVHVTKGTERNNRYLAGYLQSVRVSKSPKRAKESVSTDTRKIDRDQGTL